ncbi:MAG TPA: hypothetical protein DEB50_10990 [Desulfobacter sp.]|nr:hypothetical protein [Desulfobacter sp.]
MTRFKKVPRLKSVASFPSKALYKKGSGKHVSKNFVLIIASCIFRLSSVYCLFNGYYAQGVFFEKGYR